MTLLDMPNGIIPVSRFSSVIVTQGKYQGYYQKRILISVKHVEASLRKHFCLFYLVNLAVTLTLHSVENKSWKIKPSL